MTDQHGRQANWAWAEDVESEHWHPVATRDAALADAMAALTRGDVELAAGLWVAQCRPATLDDVVDWEGGIDFGEAVVNDATIEHLPEFGRNGWVA